MTDFDYPLKENSTLIQTYTYDLNGNLMTTSWDYDADGTAEYIQRYKWIKI